MKIFSKNFAKFFASLKIKTNDTSWDAWERHLNAAIESWWNEKNRLGDSFFGNDGKGNNYTQLAWKGTKKCKCQNGYKINRFG